MLKWIKNAFSTAAPIPAQAQPQTSAIAEKTQGDACLQRGDFAQAASHYRAALAIAPDLAAAHKMLGFVLQEQGMLAQAAQSLRQALHCDSNLADAHFGLAVMAQARSEWGRAIDHYRQAIVIAPDFDIAHRDLAVLLYRQGRIDEAVSAISLGITHCPQQSELRFVRGNLFHEQGRYAQAAVSLREALALQPESVEMLTNLGVVLFKDNQLDEAAEMMMQVLARDPHAVDAYSTLGQIWHKKDDHEAALATYRRGIEANPHAAPLHGNLGYTLQAMQRFDDAIAAYRAALAIDPMLLDAWLNLGNTLQQQGDKNGAALSYRQLLIIAPDSVLGWSNLGNVVMESGEVERPAMYYQRALTINPEFTDASNNLGNLQMMLGRYEEAIASFAIAIKHDPNNVGARSNQLFTYNFVAGVTPQQMLADAQRFGAMARRMATAYDAWPNARERDRCLRIGIVSGDLYNKAVGYFAEGVLTKLAAQSAGRMQLIAYHNHHAHDELTERIKPSFSKWTVTAGLSDARLAQQIREDGVDILIDLSGHTVNNRLTMFAWKPAPVQVSWLGYFATTGVAEIDYLIADEWTLPAGQETQFSETIWRIPNTRLCFTQPAVNVAVSPLPAQDNGVITFGCFNSLAKMTDEVVALWSRVLHAVPNSRLFLKAAQLLTPVMQQRTLQRYAAHGIAAERLILEGPSARAQYLSTYRRIDIALDPFPYTGGTTSAESLWMGVPVLTLSGDRFLSRQGIGLLMNAGLPEWIAENQEDYVDRAVKLSQDLPALATLRASLRQRVIASPIFDARTFAHNLEEALRAMWHKWCDEH